MDHAAVLASVADTIQTLDEVAGVQVVLAAPPDEAASEMGSAGFSTDPVFFEQLRASRARGARLATFDEPATLSQRVLPDRRSRMLASPEWEPMHGYLRQVEWRDYIATPLPFGREKGGVINAYLAADAVPTARLLEFLRAMAVLTVRVLEPAPVGIPRLDRLTARERDVLALLGEGLSNRELGLRLAVSERTARTHVSNVLVKLDVASRTQAALLASRAGLSPEPPIRGAGQAR